MQISEKGYATLAVILITIVALIWLVPLSVCLVMAMGSWISPRFRRLCVYHLFGPEQPALDAALRSKGEGASSPLPSIVRVPETYASTAADRPQGDGGCCAGCPGVGDAVIKEFRVEGSIVLRSGLSITHIPTSDVQDRYSPRLGSKDAPTHEAFGGGARATNYPRTSAANSRQFRRYRTALTIRPTKERSG
jgi:hypothetical protein